MLQSGILSFPALHLLALLLFLPLPPLPYFASFLSILACPCCFFLLELLGISHHHGSDGSQSFLFPVCLFFFILIVLHLSPVVLRGCLSVSLMSFHLKLIQPNLNALSFPGNHFPFTVFSVLMNSHKLCCACYLGAHFSSRTLKAACRLLFICIVVILLYFPLMYF